MPVSVTVQKAGTDRWADASGLFPFTAEVLSATGDMPKQVFVCQIDAAGTPVYYDLATPDTLLSLPVSGATSHKPGDFVRKAKVEIAFKTLLEASEFSADLDRRLIALCADWDAGNGLSTSVTTTLTGSRVPTPTYPSATRTFALRVLPEFLPAIVEPVVVPDANFNAASNAVDLGTDPVALGITVGMEVTGQYITAGTVVTGILDPGDALGVEISNPTEDASGGTELTFAVPAVDTRQILDDAQPNTIADYLDDYKSGNETTGHGETATAEGGWLPVASRPLSWGPAPEGAVWFYNTRYTDSRFRTRDFPLIAENVRLVFNGIELPQGIVYSVAHETLYWLDFTPSEVAGYPKDGNAPWGLDYVDLDDAGDANLSLLITLS